MNHETPVTDAILVWGAKQPTSTYIGHLVTQCRAFEVVLAELVRLKTLRDEVGDAEKAGKYADFPVELKKILLRYGREKKAAWELARKMLSTEETA